MMMMGMSELVLLTVLFGGAGIPFGVPPGEEDPFLAKMAPGKCLYYSSWAGMAKPDGDSQNFTERLLAEKEVQLLVRKGIKTFEKSVLQAISGQNAPPSAKLAAQLIPELTVAVISSPTAMFVESVDVQPRRADIKAAVISKLGKKAEALAAKLEQLQKFAMPDAPTRKIGGVDFYRIAPEPEAPVIYWGRMNDYLILALGDGTIEGILERGKTDAPKWLQAIGKRLPIKRRASVTYLNVKDIVQKVAMFAPDEVGAIMSRTGLTQLTAITAATGLDDQGFVSRALIHREGAPQGVLKAFATSPLKLEDLANIPADATVAAAFKLDLTKVVTTGFDLIKAMAPNEADAMFEGLKQGEQALGFRLREDLLASIGDVWQVYTTKSNGGFIAGWTASVAVKDGAKLKEIATKLVTLARQASDGGNREPQIRTLQHGDHTIHYLSVPDDDFFIAPAWCITKDRLIVGLFPQVLKGYLAKPTKSLAENSQIKRLFSGGKAPAVLGYQDTRELFRIAYPTLQYFLTSVTGQARRYGVDIDPVILPAPATIDRHLQPGTMAGFQAEDGYELLTSQTVPGSNIIATLPVSMAFWLPMVANARFEARLMSSSNNLKSIGLAMHTLHDAHRKLPAAYSTSAQGKKLLSWRVHLLPYLEQEPLYRKFKLNEPWDSPHNKKLIAQMPRLFRSPQSKLAQTTGKTRYLALVGKETMITKPSENGQKVPLGVSFAKVSDGLSQTMAVVEVNDKKAVVWTKPVDIDASVAKPFSGLFGYGRGRFNVLFGDGSVQRLGDKTAPKALKAITTRNGNEVVDLDDLKSYR